MPYLYATEPWVPIVTCTPSTSVRNRVEGAIHNMQQEGAAAVLLLHPASPSPCSRASLRGGPHGRVHCAVGGRGGNSPRVPMELWCWEGVRGWGRVSYVLRVCVCVCVICTICEVGDL